MDLSEADPERCLAQGDEGLHGLVSFPNGNAWAARKDVQQMCGGASVAPSQTVSVITQMTRKPVSIPAPRN
jgi:hypothetical protein